METERLDKKDLVSVCTRFSGLSRRRDPRWDEVVSQILDTPENQACVFEPFIPKFANLVHAPANRRGIKVATRVLDDGRVAVWKVGEVDK